MSYTLSYSQNLLRSTVNRQYIRCRRQKTGGCKVVSQQGRVETAEQAFERRLQESERVYERIHYVDNAQQFKKQLTEAGDKLVVLEVQSEEICETGMMEEPEYHWKLDKDKIQASKMAECEKIKHRFQRTARECPDTVFLELIAEEPGAQELCDELGIEVLPTLQFYRHGKKLWEHKGALYMDQQIGQGMLFYGDRGGEGLRPSEFVTEIENRSQYEEFVSQKDDKVLNCVMMSDTTCTPCIHIYPAVVALARSFKGYANFARLLADASEETRTLMIEKKIMEVPTFIFYRDGVEEDRFVGSSRGDLIGQILEQQAKFGVQPPTTTSPGKRRKRSVAKKAAK